MRKNIFLSISLLILYTQFYLVQDTLLQSKINYLSIYLSFCRNRIVTMESM